MNSHSPLLPQAELVATAKRPGGLSTKANTAGAKDGLLPIDETADLGSHALPKNFQPSRQTKILLTYFKQSIKPHVFICAAIFDLVLIELAALAGWWFWLQLRWPAAAVLSLPLIVLIGSRQRALLNLGHEGSHYNACRLKKCNDLLTDWLVGAPCFMRVAAYRLPHRRHHNGLRSINDSDYRFYIRYDIEAIDRTSLKGFLRTLRFGAYFMVPPTHYGRPDLLGITRGIFWHTVFILAPAAAVLGSAPALKLWVAFWVLPMFTTLPLIRYIAESGKHQYCTAGDVVEATVSNIGLIHHFLINPHADGYHLLHHLDPVIPFYHLATVHELLLRLEPKQYGARCLVRRRILETARPITIDREEDYK